MKIRFPSFLIIAMTVTALVFLSCTTTSARIVTPLHEAVRDGMADEAASLLSGGADPNVRDEEGRTPLHYVCANGDSPLGFLLLDAGADPDIADDNGRTALHYAAENCYTDLVAALLDAGASRDMADADGHMPADVVGCPDAREILGD